ncbi:MAG: DUF2064 domain-containing protein [Cryomorphaceae bacterium]|nr:DUF2064 domain-containing protein [Cryomorphaceae bacterium]
MSEKNRVLAIMARRPQLGKVKTRLAHDLGEKAALKVYTELLRSAMQSAISGNWSCFLFLAGEGELNTTGFEVVEQEGSDLGERMMHVFSHSFARGAEQVVLVGSDIDGLNTQCMHEAFESLNDNDIVLGPSPDGGYYLIGMKMQIDVFGGIEWSTDSVLANTLKRAQSLEKSVGLIQELNDIDTLQDFRNSSLRELDLN